MSAVNLHGVYLPAKKVAQLFEHPHVPALLACLLALHCEVDLDGVGRNALHLDHESFLGHVHVLWMKVGLAQGVISSSQWQPKLPVPVVLLDRANVPCIKGAEFPCSLNFGGVEDSFPCPWGHPWHFVEIMGPLQHMVYQKLGVGPEGAEQVACRCALLHQTAPQCQKKILVVRS